MRQFEIETSDGEIACCRKAAACCCRTRPVVQHVTPVPGLRRRSSPCPLRNSRAPARDRPVHQGRSSSRTTLSWSMGVGRRLVLGRRATPHLRVAGHEVMTPTLTGSAERSHLLECRDNVQTRLTCIEEVAATRSSSRIWAGGHPLGHSYGGMPAHRVAEQIPASPRPASFTWDGVVPRSTRTAPWLSCSRPGILPGFLPPLEALTQSAGCRGRWCRRRAAPEYPLPLDGRAIGSGQPAQVTPHPARTLYDQVVTSSPAAAGLPHTYIICPTPGQPAPRAPFAERARRNGWECHELAAGHFVFATMPAELSELLATQVPS